MWTIAVWGKSLSPSWPDGRRMRRRGPALRRNGPLLWLCRPSSRITKRRKRTPDKASSRGWSDQSFMDRMYRFTRIIADHKLISVLSAVPTMQQLDAASAFAPLHTPVALSVIRFARKHYPELPQVACFDTTFHIDLPDVARVLPIPREFYPKVFSATAFTAFPANPSCSSLETTSRGGSSSPISAMAPASLRSGTGHRSTPAWD